jgi:hypothetical protein
MISMRSSGRLIVTTSTTASHYQPRSSPTARSKPRVDPRERQNERENISRCPHPQSSGQFRKPRRNFDSPAARRLSACAATIACCRPASTSSLRPRSSPSWQYHRDHQAGRHDVNGLELTVSLGFHQPHNPSHASTPNQRTDTKLSRRRPHPQSPGSPSSRSIISHLPRLRHATMNNQTCWL